MTKINWTARIKNKYFWLTLIPAMALFANTLLGLLGIDFDVTGVGEQLVDIVESVFIILAVVGVVNDPTTAGLSDSTQAMTYSAPKKY